MLPPNFHDLSKYNQFAVQMHNRVFTDLFAEHAINLPKFKNGDSWAIISENAVALKQKIEQIGTPLKDWQDVKINRGIITGLNDAFIIDEVKRNEILNNCADEDEKLRTPSDYPTDFARARYKTI